jgi:hypothetical protein
MSDENSHKRVATEGESVLVATHHSFECQQSLRSAKVVILQISNDCLILCHLKASTFLAKGVAISRKCRHRSLATHPHHKLRIPCSMNHSTYGS